MSAVVKNMEIKEANGIIMQFINSNQGLVDGRANQGLVRTCHCPDLSAFAPEPHLSPKKPSTRPVDVRFLTVSMYSCTPVSVSKPKTPISSIPLSFLMEMGFLVEESMVSALAATNFPLAV